MGAAGSLLFGIAMQLGNPGGGGFIIEAIAGCVIAFLLVFTGYLFKGSREHDKLIAGIQGEHSTRLAHAEQGVEALRGWSTGISQQTGSNVARMDRAERDIERLQSETSTIDKRIEASRHAIRNELSALLGQFELRSSERFDKLEQNNAQRAEKLEEKIDRILEANKRGGET